VAEHDPDPFVRAVARVELRERVESRVRVVAALQLTVGGLGLLVAAVVGTTVAGFGLIWGEPLTAAWLAGLGAVLGGLLATLAAPALVAGVGLLQRRAWARRLALVLGAIELFQVPIGTILGGYTLYTLLQESTRQHFEGGPLLD
jgi:hypothetical protein